MSWDDIVIEIGFFYKLSKKKLLLRIEENLDLKGTEYVKKFGVNPDSFNSMSKKDGVYYLMKTLLHYIYIMFSKI